MSRPHVVVRIHDGSTVTIAPGAMIGRSRAAALWLADPRISEVHATVSLRGDALHLLATRTPFVVDGVPTDDVVLERGLVVHLVDGVTLEVERVDLPSTVVALRLAAMPPRVLLAPVYSVVTDGMVDLSASWVEGAAAWVVSTSQGWVLRTAAGEVTDLEPGAHLSIGSVPIEVLGLPIEMAGSSATVAVGGLDPMVVELHFDVVHLRPQRRAPYTLTGNPARLVCGAAAFQSPVEWQLLAREVWPDGAEEASLRKRFDATLAILRRKLREAGIREDLVTSDKAGRYWLRLNRRDRVDDKQ
jgi:hypothetical protein